MSLLRAPAPGLLLTSLLGGSWDLVRCRVNFKGAIGFYNSKGLGVWGSLNGSWGLVSKVISRL